MRYQRRTDEARTSGQTKIKDRKSVQLDARDIRRERELERKIASMRKRKKAREVELQNDKGEIENKQGGRARDPWGPRG